MKQNTLNYDEIQDKYIDSLICLALDQMDAIETQELIEESQGQIDPQIEDISRTIFSNVKEKIHREYKKLKRQEKREKYKKTLPRIIEIAAIFIIIIGIAIPVAIASVSSIRMKVLELLLNFEEDHVGVELHENENAAIYIPAEYLGEYFPAYLPADFEFTFISRFSAYFEMKNSGGDIIHFGIISENGGGNFDTTDAKISYVNVNNKQVLMIEKSGIYTIIWELDNHIFYAETTLSIEETIHIAESVRRISN